MKIDVLEDKKRVEVWVGNSEKDSEYVKLSLENLFKKYASEKFLVSVFTRAAGTYSRIPRS